MDSATLAAFADELEKIALSPAMLKGYLGARAAQGVGGAGALGKSLAGTMAQTSRQAVQGMTGLQRHQLGATVAGGKGARQAQQLSGQAGLAPQRARLQAAAQTPTHELTRGGVALQGRATSGGLIGRSYGPAGVSKMTGVSPAEGRRSVEAFRGFQKQGPLPAATGASSGVRRRGGVDPHAATQVSRATDATAITRPPRRPAVG